MKTQEILSIVALGLLGVCLLCGLAKMAMKGPKAKQTCNHACSLSFFAAVVLLGVSQLITEEGFGTCRAFKLDKDPKTGIDLKDCLVAAQGGKGNGENCFVQNDDSRSTCGGKGNYGLVGESRVGLCQSAPSLCTPTGSLGQECSDDSNCPEGHQCFDDDGKVCDPDKKDIDDYQCHLGQKVRSTQC